MLFRSPPGREVPLPGVVSYRTSPQRIYFTPRRATAKSAPISATRSTRHAPNAAVSKKAAWSARGLRHRKTERGGSAAAQAADLCRSGPRAVPQRTAARNRRADRAGDDVTPAMMMPAFPADRAQRRAESERRAPTLSDSGGASLRPERGREEGRKGGRERERGTEVGEDHAGRTGCLRRWQACACERGECKAVAEKSGKRTREGRAGARSDTMRED